MTLRLHPHTLWSVILGLLLITLALGLFFYTRQTRQDEDENKTRLMEESSPLGASPSSNSQVQPVVEPSAIPTPSPSTPVSGWPESAQKLLSDFYQAYKNQDRVKLATFFTDNKTEELKSLSSRLFTGLDLNGQPGGPTLFATNSAAQTVDSYVLISATAQGNGWIASVKEQRLDDKGQSIGETTTLLTLVSQTSQPDAWLVDGYTHLGKAGKYNGFLIE